MINCDKFYHLMEERFWDGFLVSEGIQPNLFIITFSLSERVDHQDED